MKRAIALLTLLAVLTVCVIVFLIPSSPIKAKGDEDFVVENGILRAFNGKGETCVIPDSVHTIGPGAFSGAVLTQVMVPSGVKTIGTQAFYECEKLGRVTIEEGVENIGMSAFASCPSLYYVDIPSTVTDIQPGVFAGDTSLSSLVISRHNKKYFYNDGVLYNIDSTELVQYLPGRKSTYFDIPFTVEKIDRYAFWGATLLTDVRISNNVPQIPDHAFSNCVGLTTIYLPESVRRIGAYGFSDCVNLYYVAMERDDVDIAKTAFAGCNKNLSTAAGLTEDEAAGEKSSKKPEKEKEAVSDNKAAVSDDSVAKEKKKEKKSSDKGSRIRRGKYGYYSYLYLPQESEKKKSSSSDKDLIGEVKISGGNALIIPGSK